MVRTQRQSRYRFGSVLGLLVGALVWYSAPWIAEQPLRLLAVRGFGMHLVLFAAFLALLTIFGRAWKPGYEVRLGQWGSAALAVYMVLCMAGHAVARQRFSAALGPQMATVQQISALPLPGGVLYWRGIAETPTAYVVSHLTLFPLTLSPPEVIPKGTDNRLVQATGTYRLVQIFHDFARFPVAEYRQQGAEQIVRYSDLRFTGYGRERSWFDLEIRLDAAGQVQVIHFLNHIFPPHHPDF
jgi:hypothetical protein